MIESKHTPGPWACTEGGIIVKERSKGLEICDVYGADVYDDRGPNDQSEAEANARLIAESPAMFAML